MPPTKKDSDTKRGEKMKVYYTIYDGWFIVIEKNKTHAYEGEALLPKRVVNWLKTNKPIEKHAFYYEIF